MSLQKSKTDSALGHRVHEHLVFCGVETPLTKYEFDRDLKITVIEQSFERIMEVLGLDLKDDSLT